MMDEPIISRRESQRNTGEKTYLEREMEIAREIQHSFLPQTFPESPDLEIAAAMHPAREVGGDFYDVIPLSGGRLGVLVGDVSGKGVPAALYMALARTLLRSHSLSARPRYLTDALESAHIRRLMHSGSLGALAALGAIQETNDYLTSHHSESCMFLTLFYAVYEPQIGLLTYVNAGHNPPLLYNALTGEQDWIQPTDMAIALMPGRPFEAQERRLRPDDVLVLYSDGVTEAFNAEGEMFEQERLAAVVQARQEASAQELLGAIEAEVAAFAGGVPQSDDITLLVMRCRSSQPQSPKREQEQQFH
jgi:sigma-B regulation protein RsbU (phosphoserine phosphatase)